MYQFKCFETKSEAKKWAEENGFIFSSLMDLKKEVKEDPYNCIPYLAGVDLNKYKYGFQWRIK